MAARKKALPAAAQTMKEMPDAAQERREIPDTEAQARPIQESKMKAKALPPIGDPKNTVMIGGTPIEIKATKLKYQRNRTATFYRVLDLYPLTDILAMEAGAFGDDRDGDKAVMDWLIAATDDEELIKKYYDELDTETIEKMLEIFKRVNKIAEKDEKLKNMEATRKEAV